MCRRARLRSLLALVCSASLIALPATAAAGAGAGATNNSPLHVDPSSPVAKEYALPLATARDAPSSSAAPTSGRDVSLFGAGIRHGIKHGSGSSTTATTTTTPKRAPAAHAVLRSGLGSGVLWMAVAAVVVVALGSAGGIALRRRR